jgi:hypothetical protein
MTTQRLVIGQYINGVNYGVRCSLPGKDALTGDSSGGDFSFDSEWNDITQTILVGTAVATTGSFGTPIITIPYASPGFIPFGEFRYVSGNSVYDDYFGPSRANGIGATLTTTSAALDNMPAGATCLYAIHKIPVMSG